jgi:hypothetical protein
MSGININAQVINQKGSPALYTDVFANRPTAGYNGRLFISTDTSQIFEDNGSSWVLIANSGIGSTGTLQVVTTNGNTTNTGIIVTAGGISSNAVTNTSLTAGSVIFAGSGGLMSEDNTNLFWDNTNKYFGIGPTAGPTAPLDIHNGSVNVLAQFNATSTNNSNIAFLNGGVGKWRIGNLYNAGANSFQVYDVLNATARLTILNTGATTLNGALTSTSLAISGGTSSQFLKANGTTDSTAYISLTSLSGTSPLAYNNTTGAFSIQVANTSQSGYLSSTDWNTFNNKVSLASFTATTPLAYNNTTGAFSIQVATSGQSGYLTNTDWNTFNNKQSALTIGNLSTSSTPILTITGGTGAVIGTGVSISIQQSSGTNSGYLSSTDWTTFNSKQTQISGTGFVKASGTTISYDNSTYYLASNPSNYITLASLSGTTPISYNTGTGAISIAQSNTSTSGYLSSTDWNTFNSKASLTAFSASPPLSYNSGTGAFSISQSSASTNGYLSSTDWSTFNNKQSALTNPVTGTGTSGYVVKFNGSTTVTNSIIQDNGSALTINGATTITSGVTATALTISGTTNAIATINSTYVNGGFLQMQKSGTNYGYVGCSASLLSGTTNDFAIISPSGTLELGGGNARGLIFSTTNAATFSSSVSTGSLSLSGSTIQSSGDFYIGTNNSNFIQFYTSNINRMIINSIGYVGINTTTPRAKLEVVGSGTINIAGDVVSDAFITGADVLPTNATGNLTIQTNDTAAANKGGSIALGGRYDTTAAAGATYAVIKGAKENGTNVNLNGYLAFCSRLDGVGVSEAARITSNKNFLIQTTTDSGQGLLQVAGGITAGGISLTGEVLSASATLNKGYYHLFTGSTGQTLTLPSPLNNNYQYTIINTTANAVTIAAATSTNIITTTNTSVASFTLIANARCFIIADGSTKYYQVF